MSPSQDMPAASTLTAKADRSLSSVVLSGVTVLSALVTLGLSIGNYFLKQRLDAAEARIKERAQAVEESKERIARYDYVYKLLSSNNEPSHRTLAINISRLALTPDEQTTLFSGLVLAEDQALSETGHVGVAALARDEQVRSGIPLIMLREPTAEPPVISVPGSTRIEFRLSSTKATPLFIRFKLSPNIPLYFENKDGTLTKELQFEEHIRAADFMVFEIVKLRYGPAVREGLLTAEIAIEIKDAAGTVIPSICILQIRQ